MNNPLMAELQALEQQLQEAETRLNFLNTQRQALGLAPRWDQVAIDAKDREVRAQVETIARLKDLVAAKAKAVAELDAAAARAAASGLDPASAMQKALADTERAKGIKNVLTYVGIGLLVVLVVWAIIKFRKGK
jgi:chromosome segregation ATPase